MATPIANPLPKLRVALLLPGLGRVHRGAETAFLELAKGLNAFPDVAVTLFGTGDDVPAGLDVRRVGCVPRERFEGWPKLPALRSECHYEEMSFILSLISRRAFRRRDFDAAIHCTFPFTNWFLRAAKRRGGPASVFVIQNGDWMCQAESREFRTFRCDGLVCTNPEYFARHRDRYPSTLIPNGVDADVFTPVGMDDSAVVRRFPRDKKIVLMTSALIASKRVADGVKAVAQVRDAFLVVSGDGPERRAVSELAAQLLPGRHLMLGSLHRGEMPALYRRADAFLHTSQDEPFGIVYLEAAASGVPVVAHDGAVPRWILGDTARFADTSDPAAVARALSAALAPDTGRALGLAARRRVLAEWTWAAQAAKYRDFLRSLVSPRRVEAA